MWIFANSELSAIVFFSVTVVFKQILQHVSEKKGKVGRQWSEPWRYCIYYLYLSTSPYKIQTQPMVQVIRVVHVEKPPGNLQCLFGLNILYLNVTILLSVFISVLMNKKNINSSPNKINQIKSRTIILALCQFHSQSTLIYLESECQTKTGYVVCSCFFELERKVNWVGFLHAWITFCLIFVMTAT